MLFEGGRLDPGQFRIDWSGTDSELQKSDDGAWANSFTGGFDRRIDPSSLSVLADLGVSEAQIERYRRLWCREDLAAARWEEAIRATSPRDNNYVATGEIPRHYLAGTGFAAVKSRLGPAVPGDG